MTIAGGTNGIDTVDNTSRTVTLNLDTTEIGTTTFGAGSDFTWTFDPAGATNPTIAFTNNLITLGGPVISNSFSSSGVTITGGTINSTSIGATTPSSGAFTTLSATGDVSLNDSGADTILIGQSGATDDTVTIAGDISLTDDQWSVSSAGVATGLTGTNTGFIAGDLSCANCIGGTEIDESTFGAITGTSLTTGSGNITTTGTVFGNAFDRSTSGALTFGATNATSIILGNASNTALTITTDGTGDSEVVLPGNSIGNAELVNSAISLAGNSGSGSVSLGGTFTITGAGINNAVASGSTITITGTEADTLASVVTRGASTSTLVSLNGGATVLGATNINTSGSNATNIGTGTNAGTITIGNASTGDLVLADANWSVTGPGAATFASVNSGSGTIQTTGTIQANDFDRSSGGALTFGNTNATTVSICNSAACDILNIGTNADADAINIGDSLDTTTLAGSVIANTFASSGVTVTGGTINNTSVGATTRSTGAFTTLAANSTVTFSGLGSAGTTALCLNGTNVETCSAGSSTATLQSAYNSGNTIVGTTGRDIEITLADLAADQVFEITQAGTADAFRVNDDGSFTDTSPFVIDANGNVGIGDATPASLLTVGASDAFQVNNSGQIIAGSITSGFGAIDTGADNITTTGTVSGNDFDRSTAGALSIGNTNASSLSLCNSTACDAITIGTNADADTIGIGDSLDTTTIAGTANLTGSVTANTFASSGVTITGGTINSTSIGASTPSSGAFTTLSATGDVTFNDSGADTILIGQSGATDDVVTIAGDLSLTDDQWSISSAGVATGLSGTNTGLIAGDLSCTNCIGATEIDESTIASTSLSDGANIAHINAAETITGGWTFNTAATTFATAINANGGITFDNSSDTLGAHTLAGTLDANTNILVNVGNAGTDFLSNGGLTLANAFTVTTGGATVTAGGITLTSGALAVNSDSITSDGTLVINAAGTVDVDDILNANSITSDAGVSIAAGNAYTGAGAVTLSSGGTNALTLDTGGAAAINIGSTTNATSVSLCNSTNCDSISIANNADADTVTIGDVNDQVAITGDQWSITDAGVLTVVSCTGCSGGTSLQLAYNGGNTIETASNNPIAITETTTGALTGDLLQLTFNQATGGTTTGDALEITLDGADANASTGNGIHLVVDQSQSTGNLVLFEQDTGEDLFVVSEAGVLTLAGGQTSDITSVVSAGAGAALALKPGTSTGASTNGAAVNITGGDGSGTTSVTGGALNLTAGSATGGSGTRNGGSVVINGGDGATADGLVTIGSANTTAINLGNATNNTTLTLTGSGLTTLGGNLTVSGSSILGTSATTITLGSTGADAITLGNGGADTITIGDVAATGVSITDNNWNISTAGAANFASVGAITPGTGAFTTLSATGDVSFNDSGADTILIGQSGATDDTVTIAGNVSITDDDWAISATGVGTNLVANDLSCTNCIGATEIDESTIASTSLSDGGNIAHINVAETITGGWTFNTAATAFTTAINANGGLTTSTADQALNFSANGTGDFVFAADNDTNLTLNATITSTNSQDLFSSTLTNQTSSGTQRGIVLTNANDAANATTESLILLDNAETTAGTLTDALRITSSGAAGGVVDAIDVSDSNITNSINIGDNTILGTAGVIDFTNFDLSGLGAITNITGVTLASGNITTPGNISTTGSGTISVGTFAAATSVPVCSNGGTLSSCNSNPSGVTLQQAYNAGNSISTGGSNIAFTLNSADSFTVAGAAGSTGSTTFSLTDGANPTPPTQLVLINNNDTNQAVTNGLRITAAAGGFTTGINLNDTDIATALVLQNGETINNGTNGAIVFTGVGQTNNGALEIDLETNTIPTLTSSTDTAIGIDEDLTFIGAQSITTTAGDLTINSAGTLQVSDNADFAGTLTAGTGDVFQVAATGDITTVTNETINGIDISAGAVSDVTDLDIVLGTGNDVVITGTANTTTTGALQLTTTSATNNNIGFVQSYTSLSGVASGNDLFGGKLTVNQLDTDGDLFGFQIINANTTAGAAASIDDLLTIQNSDTSSADGGIVDNGIRFVTSGTVITRGINFDPGDFTTEITLENAETIANQSDGTIALGTDSGALTLSLAGAAVILNTSGTLTIDSNGGTVAINDGTLSLDAQATDLELRDNTASAYTISETSDNYLAITTTDNAEAMTLGNSLTNFNLTLDKGASGNIILSDFTNCAALTTVGTNLTCGTAGSSPFTSTTGVITQTTATDRLRLTEGETGDYGLLVDTSVIPTVDLVQIDTTNAITSTSGVDALALTYRQAANAANITGSALDITIAAQSGEAGDTIRGLTINNITGGSAQEQAMFIGTGWDQDILFATDATHTLRVQDQDTAATAGSLLQIIGAAGNTTGAGGAITITAGAGGGGSGATGGGLTFTTGAGGGAGTANSGAFTILSGNAASGTAGNISLDVGTSSTGNGSILIGTAARAQTITIGSSTGAVSLNSANTSASAVDINATGTVGGNAITLDTTDGGIALTAAGASNGDITLSPTDDFNLNGTAGSLINIGTTSVTQTITLGNATNTDLALNDANWNVTGTGTGTFADIVCNSSSCISTGEITDNTIDWTDISNAMSLDADTSIAVAAGREITYNKTFTDATSENGLVINLTAADSSSSTTAQYGLFIENVASTEGADALIRLNNADADDVVANGILIGSAAGGITTGINLNDTDIATALLLQNSETINNSTNGTIALGTDSGALTLSLAGAATLSNTSGNLTIDAAGGTVALGAGDDLSVPGGDITGANAEFIDIGETDNGSIILGGAGETNNEDLEFDFETTANTVELFSSTGVTNVDFNTMSITVASCTGCGGGSLQTAYNTATIGLIETDSTNPILFTETTNESHSADLLQLTVNAAGTGAFSGDALQITLDANTAATGFTGNGLHMIIDQSQLSAGANAILVEDDAAVTLFQVNQNGATTIGAAGAVTTALTITDTDFTNALSIADNNITGTAFSILATTGTLTLDASGTVAINDATFSLAAQATDIDIINGQTSALTISEAANNYLQINTSAEVMTFGNTGTNPTYSFTGTGGVTIAGNGDGNDALTLTTGDIAITNGDLDVIAGDFNVGLDAADAALITGAANTSTTGVLGVTASSTTLNNVGLNVGYTSSSGVTAGDDLFGGKLTVTQSDLDGDLFGFQIINANTTAGAAASTDDLLTINNLDTSAADGGTVDNAIRILSSGAAITTGLNLNDSDIVTDILLQQGEFIDNNGSDGTVTIGANSGVATLSLSGTAGTLTNTAGTLTLDSNSNTLTIASSDTTLTASGLANVTSAATLTFSGDLGITGGDINGPSSENIDLGETIADTIVLQIAGSNELSLSGTALFASTDSGLDLGSSSNQFADLYLDGGNINLDNATDIDIDDALASALTISEGSNNYLTLTTTNGTEKVTLGNSGISTTSVELTKGATGNIILTGFNCSGTNGGSLTADASGIVSCSNDDGGSLTVREVDGAPSVASVSTIEFGPATSSEEFIVTDQGSGVARVIIGTQVAKLNEAETVTAGWTFNTNPTTFTTAINANGGLTTTASNQALNFTVNGSGDFVFATDADTNVQVTSTTTAPGVDMVAISNSGLATTTDTVDGLALTFLQGADAAADTNAALNIATTTTADNASDVFSGINLSLTNTSTAGTQRGIFISNANDATGGNTTESLFAIDNLDTTADTITDYLIINTASADTTAVDAIDVSDADFFNAINIGANAIAGTNFSVTGVGAIDTASTIQAGSSNVNLTLATGFIDADAITLTTAGGTGVAFSNSGLEVQSDGLTLLKGCADGQILKWDDVTDVRWECQNDNSGGTTTLQTAYDAGTPTILTDASGDLIIQIIGGATDTQFEINAASAPEIDMFNLTNSGFGTTTTAVDGLSINFVTAAVAGSRDNAGLRIAIDPSGATEAGDTFQAIAIDNITDPTGVGTAISIGTGWDTGLSINHSGASAGFDLQDTSGVAIASRLARINFSPTVASSGTALEIVAGSNVQGRGLSIVHSGAASTSTGIFVNQNGSNGAVVQFQRSGNDVFVIDTSSNILMETVATGNVGIGTLTPTSGKLEVSRTFADTGSVGDFNLTFTADTGVDTVSGLNIDVTSANDTASDIVQGLNIANLAGAGANTRERGLRIGTGWSSSTDDADVILDDTTPVIRLGATDNTAEVSITDSAATPNTLLRIKDLSTNFGALVESGAFIEYNSYFGEEWSRDRTDLSVDSPAGGPDWGDTQAWRVEETATTGDCTFSVIDDNINGIGRVANVDLIATSACNVFLGDDGTVSDMALIFDADNLPVVQMKAKPSGASSTSDSWIGLQNQTQTAVGDEPDQGIFFSNNDGANWTAVTKTSDANRSTLDCGVAINTSQFALLKIEVVSISNIRFYVDSDVSNGVSWTLCGSITTAANIPTAGLSTMVKASSTVVNINIDVDYFRVWQDDAPAPTEGLAIENQDIPAESSPLEFTATSADFNPNSILADLTIASENMEYDPGQRIDTQTLVASGAIITPELTADKIAVNEIGAATAKDIKLNLSTDGKFMITDPSASDSAAVSFDSSGNAFFAGTITADKVKANQIEGLEILIKGITGTTSITSTTSANNSLDIDKLAKASNPELVTQLNEQVNVLGETNTQVAIDIESLKQQVASISSELSTLNLLVPRSLGEVGALITSASSSALFGADLDINSATISAGLNVLGRSTLNDLSVTGSQTNGLITIDGLTASIDSIGEALKIQPSQAEDIEFLGGAITFDKDSNILIRKGRIIANDNVRGIDVEVPDGETEIAISFADTRPNNKYAINVTPSWFTQVLVTQKTTDGFKIKFSEAAPVGARIDWAGID